MRTKIQVDGLSAEPMPFFYVAPGESLKNVIERMGGTVRVESTPDLPPVSPVLSVEAADFIRTYKPLKRGSALAVYWRFHSLDAEEFDTVDEAESFLDSGEEFETLAGEAVVSPLGKVTVRP